MQTAETLTDYIANESARRSRLLRGLPLKVLAGAVLLLMLVALVFAQVLNQYLRSQEQAHFSQRVRLAVDAADALQHLSVGGYEGTRSQSPTARGSSWLFGSLAEPHHSLRWSLKPMGLRMGPRVKDSAMSANFPAHRGEMVHTREAGRVYWRALIGNDAQRVLVEVSVEESQLFAEARWRSILIAMIISVLLGVGALAAWLCVRPLLRRLHRQSRVLNREIAERRKITDALTRSEQQARHAQRLACFGLWETDMSTGSMQWISLSQEIPRMFGVSARELVGSGASSRLMHPDDRERIHRLYGEVLLNKLPYRVEYRIVRRDHSVRYLLEEGDPVFDEFGELRGFRGYMQDVSESREAEKALARSESRFRDFAETLADFLWELGPDLRFTYLSSRSEGITGFAPESLIGLSWEQTQSNVGLRRAGGLSGFLRALQDRRAMDMTLRWVRPDGDMRVIQFTARPISSDGQFAGFRGIGRDVTEQHALAEKLSFEARHDALTGLVNRHEFERNLNDLIDRAEPDSRTHVLCCLDVDQFSVINDTSGHEAGDELLREMVVIMQRSVRDSDVIARLGSDEFGLLLHDCTASRGARVTREIVAAVEEYRFVYQERSFAVAVSVGAVVIDSAKLTAAQVLSGADIACHTAKQAGGNRVVFEQGKSGPHLDQMQWVNRITEGLDADRFFLMGQRIMPANPLVPAGEHYEVLLRMRGEDGEIVSPGVILAAAERFNLATRLDRWVLDKTFSMLADHPLHLQRLSNCSINLSGVTLVSDGLLEFLLGLFKRYRLSYEKICFEITETAVIANMDIVTRVMNELRSRGCRFALDDFGSGLSSFGYLKHLDVDYLKIDGVFVKDVIDDAIDAEMVKSINHLGHKMGKLTIAEFVENDRVRQRMIDIGVDFVQGYGVARPCLLEDLLSAAPAVSSDDGVGLETICAAASGAVRSNELTASNTPAVATTPRAALRKAAVSGRGDNGLRVEDSV